MKKQLFLIIILVLQAFAFFIPVNTVTGESHSGGIIIGDTVVWESSYGKLEVYPHTSYSAIKHVQYANVTWYLSDNDIDVAFIFNESLRDAHIYSWTGSEWNEVIDAFQHTTHNGKHYYYVQSIHFVQNETRRFKWEYRQPINTTGKWDLMAKLSYETIDYALENGRYVMLDPWWDGSWDFYKTITIESDFIENDLKNFPVLVPINISIGQYCDGGNSIRFLDTDNLTEFAYQIEGTWNISGMNYAWVNLTNISGVTDTVFLMYYNNSIASDNQNPTGVWDSNFLGVYHLNESTGTTCYDSTSNNNHGTYVGGDLPTRVDSQIGYGQDFDGTGDYITFPDGCWLNSGGGADFGTWESWTESDSSADMTGFFQRDTDSGISTLDQAYWKFLPTDGGSYRTAGDTSQDEIWNTWYVDYIGSSSRDWEYISLQMYEDDVSLKVDSVEVHSDTDCKMPNETVAKKLFVGFGRNHIGTSEMDGEVDELRISDIKRSDDWLNATFHTMNQTTGFLYIGEETVSHVIVNSTTDINLMRATLHGYLNLGFGNGTYNYGFWVGTTNPVTGENAEQNITGESTISPGDNFSADANSLTMCTQYFVKAWIQNASCFKNSANQENFYTGGNPANPTNVTASLAGDDLNISWTAGTSYCAVADTTVVVSKLDGYPSDVTDGDVLQNDSLQYCIVSIDQQYFFTLFSYNVSYDLYSTGFDVGYGCLIVSVFNEVSPWERISPFGLLVSNQDGTETYQNTTCTGTHYLNLDDIPYGDDTVFVVSATGYISKTYYKDLYINQFYNYTFYLPPATTPIDPDDPDPSLPDCVTKGYTDSVTVTNPAVDATIALTYTLDEMLSVEIYNNSLYGTYGGWLFVPGDKYTFTTTQVVIDSSFLDANTTMARANYYYEDCGNTSTTQNYIVNIRDESSNPITGAKVIIKKYMNFTSSWNEIASGISDGYGQIPFALIPNILYKADITASLYWDSLGNDWRPLPILFTEDRYKTFQLKLIEPEYNETMYFGEFVFFEGFMNDTTNDLAITYNDTLLHTENAQVYVYELYNGTATLVYNYSSIADTFTFNTSVNASRTHYAVLHCNHTDFDYVTTTIWFYAVIEGIGETESKIQTGFGFNLNPLSFTGVIAAIIALIVLMTFGPVYDGLGVLACGLILGFLNIYLGFEIISLSICGVLVVLGILVLVKRFMQKSIGGGL